MAVSLAVASPNVFQISSALLAFRELLVFRSMRSSVSLLFAAKLICLMRSSSISLIQLSSLIVGSRQFWPACFSVPLTVNMSALVGSMVAVGAAVRASLSILVVGASWPTCFWLSTGAFNAVSVEVSSVSA